MQMIEISVFCVVLLLVGVVNQDIESTGIRISVHDREELMLVEHDHRAHRLAELVQQTSRSFAVAVSNGGISVALRPASIYAHRPCCSTSQPAVLHSEFQ